MRSFCTLTFLLSVAASAGAGVTMAPDAELAPAVRAAVSKILEARRTPGASVAIARGDEIVFAEGFGLADVENDVKATPDSAFRIGSVTKQFTAAAIVRLAEQGKLSLDDDVTQFVPEFAAGKKKITIRNLLNHTSGIKNYTELGGMMEATAIPVETEEMMKRFEREPRDFDPGAAFHYSNSGYYLLGMIIEAVERRPYADVMREWFFEPIGMTHTTAADDDVILKGRAQGYGHDGGETVNDRPISMTVPFAAGCIVSTAPDLVRWARELVSGGVVNSASYGWMTTPAVLPDGAPTSYGFGLGMRRFCGHRQVSHNGGINGFGSNLSWYPDDDVTIAVLCNAEDGDPDAIEREIAKLVLELGEWPPPPAPLPAADAERFVGDFAATLADRAVKGRVFLEGDKAKVDLPGRKAVPLVFLGDGRFVSARDPDLELRFEKNGARSGAVTVAFGGVELVLLRSG